MIKRLYFGWNRVHSHKWNKDFLLVTLGKPSEDWHGIEVKNHSCPLDLEIPRNIKVPCWVGIEFGERDSVESVIELREKDQPPI